MILFIVSCGTSVNPDFYNVEFQVKGSSPNDLAIFRAFKNKDMLVWTAPENLPWQYNSFAYSGDSLSIVASLASTNSDSYLISVIKLNNEVVASDTVFASDVVSDNLRSIKTESSVYIKG